MRNSKYFLLALLSCAAPCLAAIQLSDEQAMQMAQKIWYNECHGSVKGLTSWNKGEDFASMGIGHFIWYPAGRVGPFEETFPTLLAFLEKRGAVLPPVVKNNRACPWYTKNNFENEIYDLPMRQLRDFLYETRTLQAIFMVQRLEEALPKLLANVQPRHRERVESHFNRLAQDPKGLFLLLDYVNFKGYGTSPTEQYRGEGWGLLQVLQSMPNQTDNPREDFVIAAKKVLTARVKNSPENRNEEQWLKSWIKRVNSYLE